jgi:TatD DNase family protein
VLVDTHAHLYLDRFAPDRADVLHRARAAGIQAIVMPAITAASLADALALCDASVQGEGPRLYAMAGVHPCYVAESEEADLDRVEGALDDPRVVAIGEGGLDYYWDDASAEKQHRFLRRQTRMALETGLPLILHNRDKKGSARCSDDLMRILSDEVDRHGGPLRGILHCFSGPADLADRALALGLHLGLGGTLTYKKSGVAEATAHVPMDRLVLETDAPYLAPTPHRGKRNEPAYVRHVAETLALVRDLSVEDVERATTENARALFGLPIGA